MPRLLTVTPDPALDVILFVESWLPGQVMRAAGPLVCAGGKGLDASVALRGLNVDSRALCFLAGASGRALLERLRAYPVDCAPVWTTGETRQATILAERAPARHSHVFTGGITVTPPALAEFDALLAETLPGAAWLIAGGVLPRGLPPDFYAALTARARQAGVLTLLDAHTHFIRPALDTPPAILKMNRREFEQTFETPVLDLHALDAAARAVRNRYNLPALVVTAGAEGLLAYGADGCYHAAAPPQAAVNAAGAGDAASAGLAWRLSLGDDWPTALRWAAAAGAAVTLTPGTADLDRQDVLRILPQVKITPLCV